MIELIDRFNREGREYRLFFYPSAARHDYSPGTALHILGTVTHFKRNGPDPRNSDRTRVAIAGFDNQGHFLELVALEQVQSDTRSGELHIIHVNTPSKRVMDFLAGVSIELPWIHYGKHK